MTDREKLQDLTQGWQPPPELQRSRPRPVRFTATGRILAIVAALLAAGGIGLGAFLTGQREREMARDRQLDEATGHAQARILRLWRSGDKNRRCRATYQFEAGGARVTRNATVPCSAWRSLKEGEQRLVVFVEAEPQISRLEGIERSGTIPALVPFVPAVLLPLFSALLWWDLRRQRRLLEDGRPAPAVVTKLGMRTDKGRKVYYEFLTYAGSAAKGSYGPVHKSRQMTVGDRLTVIYDSDSPGFNKRYPLQTVTLDI
jgi:hypothetical protein